MDGRTNGLTNRLTNRLTDELSDRPTDRPTDRWTDWIRSKINTLFDDRVTSWLATPKLSHLYYHMERFNEKILFSWILIVKDKMRGSKGCFYFDTINWTVANQRSRQIFSPIGNNDLCQTHIQYSLVPEILFYNIWRTASNGW